MGIDFFFMYKRQLCDLILTKVMTIPRDLAAEAANLPEVRALLSNEYQRFWHKNMSAGDYKVVLNMVR